MSSLNLFASYIIGEPHQNEIESS